MNTEGDAEVIELSEEQYALDLEFLAACRSLSFDDVKSCVEKDCDTWIQDPVTGSGPLHLVIIAAHASLFPNATKQNPSVDEKTKIEEMVLEGISYLLANGAIWNHLDASRETPACVCRRLLTTASPLYTALINAGIRAELLLSALPSTSPDASDPGSRNSAFLSGRLEYTEVLVPRDAADGDEAGKGGEGGEGGGETRETLLDEERNAIMMSWEADIMARSAEILIPTPGSGAILNIGFGLGIIDTFIQSRNPTRHVIVEAHPDVLAKMRREGWHQRPNVTVLEGRWQDVLDGLAEQETFDAVYYDPFEYWSDMLGFFDAVVALLKPDGVFSFFHGLGADNQTFYDVYTGILEIELKDFGMDVEFMEMEVKTRDEEWEGTKRRYWALDKYRLPICRFMQ